MSSETTDERVSGLKQCHFRTVKIVIIVAIVILVIWLAKRKTYPTAKSSPESVFVWGLVIALVIIAIASVRRRTVKNIEEKIEREKHRLEALVESREQFKVNESRHQCRSSPAESRLRELTNAEFIDRIPLFDELSKKVGSGSGFVSEFLVESSHSHSSSSDHSKKHKKHHSKKKHRKHRSPSHSSDDHSSNSDSDDSCDECKDGGLGASCNSNSDCACGLKCQGKKCVCPKPPPPQIHIQMLGPSNLNVTWPPVAGADYYDVYLINSLGQIVSIQIFYTQTSIEFPSLDPGLYYVYIFSGSSKCGMSNQFTQSPPIQIGRCDSNSQCPSETPFCTGGTCVQCLATPDCPNGLICRGNLCIPECTQNSDCPQGDLCLNQHCVVPQCTVDAQCPQGQFCSGNNCVNGCVNSLNCPQGDTCVNGTCTAPQCTNNNQCTTDQVCVSGNCVCPTPTITGVTVTASWPNPLQFHFTTTGVTGVGSFVIPWRATGSTGQTAVSGFLALFPLPGNLWPTAPSSNFPQNTNCTDQPCCSAFNFGCTQSGCGGNPAPNVQMDFLSVTVTNACGQTSTPTCWRFTSLCPGSSAVAIQQTC